MGWICLVRGREQGFCEHSNLHWTSDLILALSNGPNWCLHKFPPDEGIKKLPKHRVLSNSRQWTKPRHSSQNNLCE
jgi:hypothetical protein